MPADLLPPAENRETLPGNAIIIGDSADDDARVIDSLVEQNAEPPAPDKLPVSEIIKLPKPAPLTRLMTQTLVIPANPNGWVPVLLLPADPRRIALRVRVVSATATDHVHLSDDSGKVQTEGGSALLFAGDTFVTDATHTGPVWIYAPDAVGPVTVSALAVTS